MSSGKIIPGKGFQELDILLPHLNPHFCFKTQFDDAVDFPLSMMYDTHRRFAFICKGLIFIDKTNLVNNKGNQDKQNIRAF